MEQELASWRHGVFIDFKGEDLVKVFGVELVIFIAIPDPNFSIAAFHVFLLIGWGLGPFADGQS